MLEKELNLSLHPMGRQSTVSANHGTKVRVNVPETGAAGVGHKVTAYSSRKDRERHRSPYETRTSV